MYLNDSQIFGNRSGFRGSRFKVQGWGFEHLEFIENLNPERCTQTL